LNDDLVSNKRLWTQWVKLANLC